MDAVAVCSARSGCFACGMVSGDGGGSAEHAGVGQERLTTKLRITLLPGKVISRSSTSSAKSQVLVGADHQVDVGQPQSTLRTRRERVSEGQKHSHRPALAAGSVRSFQERSRSSTGQPPGQVLDKLASSAEAPRPLPHSGLPRPWKRSASDPEANSC